MAAFNKVVLAGNLTRDPELRFTNSGIPVCNFGIAVNRVRSKSEEADYFDVTAWRELGETVANYKTKGDPILIEGRLQYSSWENNDGQKRSKVDVVAENIQFLARGQNANNGGGASSEAGSGGIGSGKQAAASGRRGGPGEAVAADDEDFDDIPFAHRQGAPVVF